LRAEGGAGIEIASHDLKFGRWRQRRVGVKAYGGRRPTMAIEIEEYLHSAAPWSWSRAADDGRWAVTVFIQWIGGNDLVVTIIG